MADLQAENARLVRLLRLSSVDRAAPGAAQTGMFKAPPRVVHTESSLTDKAAFFGALFAARTDIYATRWENRRSGRSGWLPAVRGGWRRGVPHAERDYLPLTAEVLDALAYVKAARALGVPAALEVSRSGTGAHVWCFFTAPVEAAVARNLGSGLLREAMTLRGHMDLSSYDRLYVGRILRSHPRKTTAEVHDYHDVRTGVLAASLAKRAPGYTSLGFTDPRRLI